MKPASVTIALLLALTGGGPVPAARAADPVRFYSENLDTDPGWSRQSDWAFGPPAGQGGCAPHPTPSPGLCTESWGYPDPSSGHTGNNVYGYNLNGDYPHNLPQTYYLTTAAIDCRGWRTVNLKFRRWLNVERSNHDLANLQVSSDGVRWVNIWTNPGDSGKPVTDYSWGLLEYGIGPVADNQAAVRVRWGMGPTDASYTCSGWNIDDVELWGIPIPSPTVSPVPTTSPTPSATPTSSTTPTATPTPTPFGYKTATPTPTPPPTATPTVSPPPTATPPPTFTPSPTRTPTPTPSPSITPTPSVTPTMIPTATPIPTPTPGVPLLIYRFHLDSDPGWTTESAWAFARPMGGCEETGFFPNPTAAHSGEYVYGFNPSGCYGALMPPYSLTTTAIDCSELVKTRLVFHRWLNIERRDYDRAAVTVSPDGWNWHTVWENPVGDWVRDSSWQREEYNISSVADRQAAVYVRWVMGPTDEWVNPSGWNLDDIEIWAVPPGPPPFPTPTRPFTPTPAPTPAATPLPALPRLDYNGNGTSDIAIFRPAAGLWAVRSVTRVYFGSGTDIPVPGDYDGDGTTDLAVFRGSSGLWAIRSVTRAYFGGGDDLPRPAAWGGGPGIGIAIFRPAAGLWAVRGLTRFYFGSLDDTPAEGYYAGLPAAAGVFREGSGLWAVRGVTRVYFGSPSDRPLPGDYDGEGRWRPGIFRPATGLWAIRGVTRVYFGSAADFPAPGGYGGGGIDRAAIFRPASGLWAVRGLTRAYFGGSGDTPVSR